MVRGLRNIIGDRTEPNPNPNPKASSRIAANRAGFKLASSSNSCSKVHVSSSQFRLLEGWLGKGRWVREERYATYDTRRRVGSIVRGIVRRSGEEERSCIDFSVFCEAMASIPQCARYSARRGTLW